MANRCAIYSRVSTDAQERDGTSLETQERACLEYARAAGWRVVEQVRDSASGFSLERKGLSVLRNLATRAEIDETPFRSGTLSRALFTRRLDVAG